MHDLSRQPTNPNCSHDNLFYSIWDGAHGQLFAMKSYWLQLMHKQSKTNPARRRTADFAQSGVYEFHSRPARQKRGLLLLR